MLDTIPFTSVHSNLEHGLVILTESFSPLRSVLHNLSCWSLKQKCTLSYAIPFNHVHLNYIKLVLTGLIWFEPATATKVDMIAKRDMSSGKFHCYCQNPLCLMNHSDVILSHSWGWKSHNLALFPCFFVLSYQRLDLDQRGSGLKRVKVAPATYSPPLGKHFPRCFKI